MTASHTPAEPGTPLPWFAEGCLVGNKSETRLVCEASSQEGARYIVTAANAFPDLVEALQQIAGNNWRDQTRARHVARAALAKAKEPST